MANSEFEYTRFFEQTDVLLPDTWIVVRLDGRGFSKFTKRYNFVKPNDKRAIDLMNSAALETMRSLVDIVVAYGQSDEYSFVFHKDTQLFERRAQKLVTTIVSTFSVQYALQWPKFFPDEPLTEPYPTFDGRHVLYPNIKTMRDYLSWRQADCHVNNLYNTTFWAMVNQGGQSPTDAELELKGTFSADKNEILFSRFGINYNNEPEVYKKGTVIYRDLSDTTGSSSTTNPLEGTSRSSAETTSRNAGTTSPDSSTTSPPTNTTSTSTTAPPSKTQLDKERKRKLKATLVAEHVDIIKDGFWERRPWILAGRSAGKKGTH
ncbi:Thg1 C terminal domain-containing protein [Elsinoe ampelina]|uniref:tRNA(His) guanylyltransferase n=1 Tax=Elsinoe ampelina TaxID=302913 RepID=A0A6A6FYA4_9PEZI|nr:Thg1 C terminal domain-containing protein [Elsinoe ampelina]